MRWGTRSPILHHIGNCVLHNTMHIARTCKYDSRHFRVSTDVAGATHSGPLGTSSRFFSTCCNSIPLTATALRARPDRARRPSNAAFGHLPFPSARKKALTVAPVTHTLVQQRCTHCNPKLLGGSMSNETSSPAALEGVSG